MTMNAPAGPPICTLEPRSALIRKPATIAVMMPCSGLTPEAMPNAIASGRATTPTVMPAATSLMKRSREYPRSVSARRGRKRWSCIGWSVATRDVGADHLGQRERRLGIDAGNCARRVVDDRLDECLGLGEQRVAFLEMQGFLAQRAAVGPSPLGDA